MSVDPSATGDSAGPGAATNQPSVRPHPTQVHPPPDPATPAMRLQIMSTEHWSLLASRQLSWTESFSRAGMFLSTLSFATVALALVAQATQFGEAFRIFALVILPVVLFLGIGTMLRLDNAGYHDIRCIIGMNRIRAGYLQLAPDLEPFFVMGTTDDRPGVELTMSNVPRSGLAAAIVAAVPTQIGVLNAVLLGVIAALAAVQLGADTGPAVAVGAAGFLVGIVAFALYIRRGVAILLEHRPLFTSEDG